MRGSLLDIQLFMVLAHSSSFCREGVEHHGRVDEIFLHALKPCIQLLEPHQLSGIWGKKGSKNFLHNHRRNPYSPNCNLSPHFNPSCKMNMAKN